MMTFSGSQKGDATVAWARTLVMLLSLLTLTALAENEPRLQEIEYDFDIPRTSRVLALHELSRQANGLLLGYLSTTDAEEQALVGPIRGFYTIEAVLRTILASSTLTFRWISDEMVSVEPLAIGEPELDPLQGALRTRPHSGEFDPLQGKWREEVLVLGWPLRDLTLSVSPAVIYDRDDIDATGAPTLPDALRYLSQSAYSRPDGYRSSGAQYAEMRGLGPDTTLVLINGRRTVPSANSIATSAFDLNTIPVPAVERIEFLLDSAAAAYGTDAIGGVINIVLRNKVARPTLEARYGGAEGGASQERLTFSGGVNGDRFHGALVLDYFDIGGLLGGSRSLWRDQDYRRYGGRDLRTLYSSPGNISALGGNLPGLLYPIAGVPSVDSTTGVSRDDFLATAGQPNLDSVLRFSSVVPESQRLTATANGVARLGSSVAVTAELLRVDRESTYYFAPPVLPSYPVPATNYYNPFGTTVLAARLLTEYPSQYQVVESDLLRAVLALHGDRGAWDWEISALHSEEEAQTWIGNALDMQRAVPMALASPNAAEALNPFSPGPVGSPELLDGLLAPRDVDEFSSKGKQFAGFIQGPVWPLPGGPMTVIIGGEWRNEAMNAATQATASFDRDRDVAAAYAQLRLPLISEYMKLRGAHELTVTAGTRWDDYSDFGHVLRSQVGVLWKPHRDWSVRASGGSSFRPPSLYELYLPRISVIGRVTDPARNESATVTFTSGGNSELLPVTARSLTGGVLFSPDTKMNWQVSADYWRIDMQDRVVSVPLSVMLANEQLFADRIVRDPATDPSRPGILRSVDASRINVGAVKVSGVDVAIKADFQTDAGRFSPELQATWFDKFESTDLPGHPAMDRVGVASELGTILDWRAVLSLKWKRGPFGAAMFLRHTPSYDDAIAGVRTGRNLEAQTLFDLQGTVDFGMLIGDRSHWDDMKLWIGANNLFNDAPSFAEVGDSAGFDSSQGELKQRTFYLRLDKKF